MHRAACCPTVRIKMFCVSLDRKPKARRNQHLGESHNAFDIDTDAMGTSRYILCIEGHCLLVVQDVLVSILFSRQLDFHGCSQLP
jgi:hypothetical protein